MPRRKIDKVKILKEENKKLRDEIKRLEEIKKELEGRVLELKNKLKMIVLQPLFMNEDNVMALGTMKIDENYRIVRVSIKYIEKGLKIVKELGNKDIDIAVANDEPFVMGTYEESSNKITGILVAPKEMENE